MPRASIDIGSNTVRLLIADLKDCRIIPLRYRQAITRLARGLNDTCQLGEQAMNETVEVLRTFKDVTDEFRVSDVVASGTEALRSAENASELISRASTEAGIVIEVLPRHLEAQLMALGVTRSLPESSNALILDVGGASTEAVVVREGRARFCQTTPTGVVKLLEQYISNDPPVRGELEALKAVSMVIGDEFFHSLRRRVDMDNETLFVSTAGTPTMIAAMDLGLKEYDHARVHGHRMSIDRLEDILMSLAAVSVEERVRMGCLDFKRADLIIPGLILTIGIMKSFGFHEMIVSDHGLLEGLLLHVAGCGY